MLRNLLSNAVKYSHEEGRIVFGYESAANRYVLRDEGVGMDEQQRARLFVGRVGSRLGTRHESGYGIGLHLVHELVRKNNGRIGAHSVLTKEPPFILPLTDPTATIRMEKRITVGVFD